MLSALIMVVVFLATSSGVKAFTCLPAATSSCPDGANITNLIKITGCTPRTSFCVESTDRSNSATCQNTPSSCSFTVDVKDCEEVHEVIDDYSTEVVGCNLVSRNVTNGCCRTSGPNGCGGDCDTGSDCKDGLSCSGGGKCVNPLCPADADCVCGGGGDSCSVTITGENSIESGSEVLYDIGVTGDGDPETLGLSAPGFDDGEGKSTFEAKGSAMHSCSASVSGPAAVTVGGTETYTASVTQSNGSYGSVVMTAASAGEALELHTSYNVTNLM